MKNKPVGWRKHPVEHALARHGISTRKKIPVHARKVVDWDKGYLTEVEVNLLKNRINRGEDVDITPIYESEGYPLTPEQNKKGYDFLTNLWKTPKGKERVTNPFGYREQSVLEDFNHIEIVDFYDTARYGQEKWVVPYYRVVAKDGSSFEYAYYGGKIHLLG